jgi:hypothetical protein
MVIVRIFKYFANTYFLLFFSADFCTKGEQAIRNIDSELIIEYHVKWIAVRSAKINRISVFQNLLDDLEPICISALVFQHH